ncbi:porin family protein [Bacteroides heparinolyticus]|uniref:porin family protein n=1 Tax=Prevotella heparinolytica TaxID=28113 RepID=UPI0035A0BEAD
MKKKIMLVLFALVVSMSGFAQVSWNVKGGLNMSTYVGDNTDDAKFKPGVRIGVGMEYALSEIMSLQPSLYLSSKGAKFSGSANFLEENIKGDITFNQTYLELPVNLQFRFNAAGNTNIVVAGGPYFAYGIGGKTTATVTAGDNSIKEKADTFGKDGVDLNRFDAGINIEAGLEFGAILVGINTQLGVCRLGESGSPRNANIGVTVGYKF